MEAEFGGSPFPASPAQKAAVWLLSLLDQSIKQYGEDITFFNEFDPKNDDCFSQYVIRT